MLNDTLYGGDNELAQIASSRLRQLDNRPNLERIMLHSDSICFREPVRGVKLNVAAPLPYEISLLKRIAHPVRNELVEGATDDTDGNQSEETERLRTLLANSWQELQPPTPRITNQPSTDDETILEANNVQFKFSSES